jgi:hypothetical protein
MSVDASAEIERLRDRVEHLERALFSAQLRIIRTETQNIQAVAAVAAVRGILANPPLTLTSVLDALKDALDCPF